jgi:hypothetical protein
MVHTVTAAQEGIPACPEGMHVAIGVTLQV